MLFAFFRLKIYTDNKRSNIDYIQIREKIMTDIYFRTDGNSIIATGHIMRCLTIARACVKRSAKVKFIVSDEESLTLMQERFAFLQEFEVLCLHSDYTNLMGEIPVLSALPAQEDSAQPSSVTHCNTASPENKPHKPWIFVDSYYATPDYLLSLRDSFRVAYLDDLREFDCPVDLVINYDTDEDCAYYAKADQKLLGLRYTPLREQFANTAYTVREAVKDVLLSTGGTDPYAIAEHLLYSVYDEAALTQDIRTLQSLHYHILTSSSNTRYDILSAYAQKHPNIHIHEGIADVASLMASCDLAVCAGGTTLCEVCAVGVPAISYLMADNQRTAVNTYASLGLIPYAGDIRTAAVPRYTACTESPDFLPTVNPDAISSILSFITHMSQDVSKRQKSSQSMRAFLNGDGADQIACALVS